MLPVFSLRALLGFPERPVRLSDMLVIARAGSEDVALWVDETRGVMEIPPATGPSEKGTVAPLLPGISITDTGIVITDLVIFLADPGPAGAKDRMCIPPPAGDQPRPVAGQEEAGRDPGQVKTVLSERAAKMLHPEPGTSVAEFTEILRFQLAYQEYAIGMDYVREVILTGEITPVPGTPDFISGICASRGQIISLVDLRVLFKIPEKGLTDLNRVIVLTDGKLTFGILADTISGVGTIARDQVRPPGPGDLPGGRGYLKGVMDGGIWVLDAAAILGDPGIIIDEA
jgi:chemotaxis signal transduction protein